MKVFPTNFWRLDSYRLCKMRYPTKVFSYMVLGSDCETGDEGKWVVWGGGEEEENRRGGGRYDGEEVRCWGFSTIVTIATQLT